MTRQTKAPIEHTNFTPTFRRASALVNDVKRGWLCEVPWHSHTGPDRTPTCRPDSLRHPELERDEQ